MSELDPLSPAWSLDRPCFEAIAGTTQSPFVLACDHAGREIPSGLGNLGVSEADLHSHIAWDIGIAGTSRRLADLLGADLFLQRISRLVIDCNRPLTAPDSIPETSAGISIAGNVGLDASEIERRRALVFHPYHCHIASVIDERIRRHRPTVFVAMHSFTPVFRGSVRPWHAGVLYQRDSRLASALLELLRKESGLVVGDNEPYRVTDQSDYSVIQYGERRGLLHVEVEVRQDLIGHPEGQQQWAERLARLLELALRMCEGR